jgi:hypothetical protein
LIKKTVIFDLDGTLAIIEKRKKISRKPDGRINWEIFFKPSNISLDQPNEPVVKIAQLFALDGYKIVILSGRSDRTFEATNSWLLKYNIPYDKLIMRPDKFLKKGDKIADGNIATQDMRFMPDEVLKKNMLDTFLDVNDIFLVVDDRDKVVKMWRSLGLKTFQVDYGNF